MELPLNRFALKKHFLENIDYQDYNVIVQMCYAQETWDYDRCRDEIAKVAHRIQSRKTPSSIRSLTTPKKEPNDDGLKKEGTGGNNKVIPDAIWEKLPSKERKQLVSKIKNQPT